MKCIDRRTPISWKQENRTHFTKPPKFFMYTENSSEQFRWSDEADLSLSLSISLGQYNIDGEDLTTHTQHMDLFVCF